MRIFPLFRYTEISILHEFPTEIHYEKSEKEAGKIPQNRALKFEKHTKCQKIFSNHFLLGFWLKIFLTSIKLIHFLKSVSVNFFQMNAHQKARQETYLDVQNKNSFIIIHRE